MTAPCRGCPERHEACHDRCPTYQAYKAEREAIRKERAFEMILVADDRLKAAERRKLNRYKRDH